MQLFYHKDLEAGALLTLDPEESRHAIKVLRRHAGDTLYLTNGRGEAFDCRILDANPSACLVEASASPSAAFPSHASTPRLHLALAPTKNPARTEWLVEKTVEMGISEIALLQCDHSERTFLKTDRLEKLAISAMKQSLRTTLPTILPPVSFAQWLTCRSESQRLIAHCEADLPRTPLASALLPNRDTALLIGPEGDFSPSEIAAALDRGFLPVSLGHARLRTETAALFAVAAFNLINTPHS
ncbi:MAG: 16S rRNA (uracil(1498)-N(3))-methyltransferase [Bacteroidales bacterium]|nr:16S rRNA (uracil(1498)-N(3))-methyltransferase [Bacteroidales bacterium]